MKTLIGIGTWRGFEIRYVLEDEGPGKITGSIELQDPTAPIHTFFTTDPNAPMQEMKLADGRRLLFVLKSYERVPRNTADIIGGRFA